MKSLKVAAVTVLYYPDQEVIRKIGSYISFVEKLYVIDNSEIVDRAFSCLLEGTYEEKIRLIANHQNRGIAYALDQGIEKAYNAGFSWVLMMDQDSEFRPGTPEILFNALRKYDNSDKVGIFSGNIELIGGKNSIVDKGLTNLKTALTSGSILNLAAYYDTGPFSERFFIDQVDHEYCLRLRRRRYEILRCDAALIMHSLGDTCIHRFLGRKI
ncbi:MAG TPA: glycosyltransferase, partial [Candidatus Babeliaceae bacterium]|nr:glycosyltransferase [Candidatus Babeliaceae bacterium]